MPENINSLMPVMIIKHPLWASSIYYDPQHPSCSIYVLDSLFAQPVSKSSLVYPLVWNPPLHTPYISSPNHCILLATYAHTIATCSAVVLRLCHLFLIFLSTYYLQLLSFTLMSQMNLPTEVPPDFLSSQARSHFHATYYFAHNCCTLSYYIHLTAFFFQNNLSKPAPERQTILDFNRARDDGWQWHQLDHMKFAPCSRQTTMPAPHHSVFTGRMPFLPPNCSIYMPDSLSAQPLSKSSLDCLLVWHPPLHTLYISSPNHCLHFATRAHTIATCFAIEQQHIGKVLRTSVMFKSYTSRMTISQKS